MSMTSSWPFAISVEHNSLGSQLDLRENVKVRSRAPGHTSLPHEITAVKKKLVRVEASGVTRERAKKFIKIERMSSARWRKVKSCVTNGVCLEQRNWMGLLEWNWGCSEGRTCREGPAVPSVDTQACAWQLQFYHSNGDGTTAIKHNIRGGRGNKTNKQKKHRPRQACMGSFSCFKDKFWGLHGP